MARIARLVVPGHPQHVTQRGVRSIAIFRDDDDRQEGEVKIMYTGIIFWFSGILFTLGFNYQIICPNGISLRHKIDAIGALSFYYLFA